MRTIVAGSRSIKDSQSVFDVLDGHTDWPITEVVCGCAQGPDIDGAVWAGKHGIPVVHFPADWITYGRAAGPIRNKVMAQHAEALIAIWDGKSRGTEDMIEQAEIRKLKVHVAIY